MVHIGNGLVERGLTSDGHGHSLTTKFTAMAESLATQSDESHILTMDGREFTVADFVAENKQVQKGNETSVRYVWPAGSEPHQLGMVLAKSTAH